MYVVDGAGGVCLCAAVWRCVWTASVRTTRGSCGVRSHSRVDLCLKFYRYPTRGRTYTYVQLVYTCVEVIHIPMQTGVRQSTVNSRVAQRLAC